MSDTPNGNDTPNAAVFQPAHTRTLSSSHTRTLSSSHVVPNVHQLQTAALAAHTQQLTSIPPELPQLTVTTPTTIYSAYTSQSTPSSFGTTGGGSPFSPPTHVPDVPVPAVPEQYRRQAAIEDSATVSPPHSPPSPPALIITNATPPPTQARFASPMTANPNAPILPRLATPGSAVTPSNVARKPIPAIITSPPTDGDAIARVKAGTRSYSPPMRNSPGAGGKTWSPPSKPYAAGSMSTMSPVAAARSFNNRAGAATRMHPHHVKHDSNASDTIDSPTVATTKMYAATKGRDKADISTADRVVGRETLFDLDIDVDEEKGTADARELPLADLMGDELPEYIQVYLTPHPDREGMGAKGAFGDEKDDKAMLGAGFMGDEKLSSKEKDAMASEDKEYERRAAKWNDIEATLPAYKSTPSLHRAAPFGRAESTKAAAPKRRRCVPAKTSTRILCLVILFLALLVIPLVIFGVVYSLQLKGKHENGPSAEHTAPSAQEVPGNNTLATFDAPPPPPPIVAPMTTSPAGEPQRTAAENQVAIGQGGGGGN